MSKKVKVLVLLVLFCGLIYVNRAGIRNFISKLPFIDKGTSVSEEETQDKRGSYEYYYHSDKDDNTDINERNAWRMNSKD